MIMIEDAISVHDKHQFEIKLGYKLLTNKNCSYTVETYMFIPSSLGINSRSYSKADFYNDLQGYIRLKTPVLLLQNIVRGEDQPLEKLKTACLKMVQEYGEETESEYENHIKMFCCILKSAMRDHVHFTCGQEVDDDTKELIQQYVQYLKEISIGYRELRFLINVPTIPSEAFSKYLFGDEYLSHLIESYTFYFLEELKKKEAIVGKAKVVHQLLSLIKEEVKWRKEHNYPSVAEKNSDNEVFVFRSSVLKKYISSVLYLNTRLEPEGVLMEQIIYGVAAGLSMLFATAVAFYIQSLFGNLTFPLFIALIVSYMFKDRIKELLRVYFRNKLQHFMPDFKRYIFSGPENKMGICKESFEFIKESRLDPKLLELRNRDHITAVAANESMGEKVILYKKSINLFSARIQSLHPRYHITAINDIMRFNITRFLSKMDDPHKELFISDENGGYHCVKGSRVYHLNLLIKFISEEQEGKKITYERFRIVLNRQGIKRLDEIITMNH